MSFTDRAVKGALCGLIGGTASFVASKVLAPYVWESTKSYLSATADVAKTALKTSAIFGSAIAFAAVGCTTAYWISKQTDQKEGNGFELEIRGWNAGTIRNVHTFVPILTTAVSCTPLAYLSIRLLF